MPTPPPTRWGPLALAILCCCGAAAQRGAAKDAAALPSDFCSQRAMARYSHPSSCSDFVTCFGGAVWSEARCPACPVPSPACAGQAGLAFDEGSQRCVWWAGAAWGCRWLPCLPDAKAEFNLLPSQSFYACMQSAAAHPLHPVAPAGTGPAEVCQAEQGLRPALQSRSRASHLPSTALPCHCSRPARPITPHRAPPRYTPHTHDAGPASCAHPPAPAAAQAAPTSPPPPTPPPTVPQRPPLPHLHHPTRTCWSGRALPTVPCATTPCLWWMPTPTALPLAR